MERRPVLSSFLAAGLTVDKEEVKELPKGGNPSGPPSRLVSDIGVGGAYPVIP